MKSSVTKRYYIYIGSCLTCESTLEVETKQNFGQDHYIQCPICADPTVPSVSLLRVGMGKNDENKHYTYSVKGSGMKSGGRIKKLSSN